MEEKTRHLEMIQGVIARMTSNCLAMKEWTVALIVGCFAFFNQNIDDFIFIVVLPILVFLILDTYYLSLERRYRKLYDTCRNKNETEFEMAPPKIKHIFFKSMLSVSIWPLYSLFLLMVIIIYLLF